MRKKMVYILVAGMIACSTAACSDTAKSNVLTNTEAETLLQSETVSVESAAKRSKNSEKVTKSEENTEAAGSDSVLETETSPESDSTGQESDSTGQKSDSTGQENDSTSEIFTSRDLNQSPDLSSANTITVSDGKTINITEEGIYVIKGTASDCVIMVEADKQAKVQLVLDGVNITNSTQSVIYVVSADKCFITTTDSTNSLSVTGEFAADDSTGDAVIYSKDDLVLNGTGQLSIVSSKGNGISGKDDVKITGGTYQITSAEDSIEANDSISVYDGNFTINSSKDGLHSEYSDDDTVGSVYIAGGSFTINASSDAIQATTIAAIDGGTFNLTAGEGIEATYVQINDGTIHISASDDGINASCKSSAYAVPTVEINGGTLTIVMGQGDTDAIDVNGNIVVNGGTIDITAQVSSFDYDGSAEYNGGTIIINGSQVDSIPQSMMGGRGGMGDMNGMGEMNGGFGERGRGGR